MTAPTPGSQESTTATVALARAETRRATVAASLEGIAAKVNLRGVRQVLVKPNFVTPHRQLATTHVDGVRATLDFIRQRYDGPVVIAEGAAMSPTEASFRAYGYQSLVKEYGVELRDQHGIQRQVAK